MMLPDTQYWPAIGLFFAVLVVIYAFNRSNRRLGCFLLTSLVVWGVTIVMHGVGR